MPCPCSKLMLVKNSMHLSFEPKPNKFLKLITYTKDYLICSSYLQKLLPTRWFNLFYTITQAV